MKKYFVQSDIHSFFTIWMKELIKKGFEKENQDHILIILGDLFDRGSEPQKIIDFLKEIGPSRYILVRGNHEDLFLEMIKRGYPLHHDEHNGTDMTAYRLFGVSWPNEERLKKTDIYKIINNSVDFYETNKYIFVHGFLPVKIEYGTYVLKPNWRSSSEEEWHNARWINGFDAGMSVKVPDKTIVFGHFTCQYGHKMYNNKNSFQPFKKEGIIGIDACTVLSKKVNILVFNEDYKKDG